VAPRAGEVIAVSVQPAPGAVFLSLRRDGRRALVEMSVGEAVALRRERDGCIGIAAASAAG
jgi:hypothetical protein